MKTRLWGIVVLAAMGGMTTGFFISGLGGRSASAADYYVATDGDDANPGTLEKPFKSPVKAAAKLMPGDTLVFRAGDYVCQTNSTVGLAPSRSGEPGKPITFRTHNNEHVHIDGGRSDWGFTPDGYSWIVIDGFEVTGPTHYGMKISANHNNGKQTGEHITVRNCEVHGSGMENIFAFGTPYLTVENCHLHDSGQSHGLYLQVGCNNACVRNVTSEDNHGNSGIQLNAAGGGITNALIENCLIRNNAQGLSLMELHDSVIRGNVLYNDCFAGPRDSGYREVILWTYGAKGQPCSNVLFENNTIVNLRPAKIDQLFQIKNGTAGLVLRNNILVIGAKRPLMNVAEDSVAGMKWEGNLWSTAADYQVTLGKNNLSLDEFCKQIKSTGKNIQGDPMLTDPDKGDFAPKAGSPAIGAGVPAGAAKKLDIGAVQSGKSGSPVQIGCKLPWKKTVAKEGGKGKAAN